MRTMQKLTREDLFSLEQYSDVRAEFRDRVLAHKRDRRLELGTNAALYFEDRMTMQYQVQEMLRIERIFEAEGLPPPAFHVIRTLADARLAIEALGIVDDGPATADPADDSGDEPGTASAAGSS